MKSLSLVDFLNKPENFYKRKPWNPASNASHFSQDKKMWKCRSVQLWEIMCVCYKTVLCHHHFHLKTNCWQHSFLGVENFSEEVFLLNQRRTSGDTILYHGGLQMKAARSIPINMTTSYDYVANCWQHSFWALKNILKKYSCLFVTLIVVSLDQSTTEIF